MYVLVAEVEKEKTKFTQQESIVANRWDGLGNKLIPSRWNVCN